MHHYQKNLQYQLLFIALSRVTSLEDLFFTNVTDDFIFLTSPDLLRCPSRRYKMNTWNWLIINLITVTMDAYQKSTWSVHRQQWYKNLILCLVNTFDNFSCYNGSKNYLKLLNFERKRKSNYRRCWIRPFNDLELLVHGFTKIRSKLRPKRTSRHPELRRTKYSWQVLSNS